MTKEEVLKAYPDVDINESGGLDNFQEDKPIVERTNIAAIIQHPTEELYLIAKWSNDWCGFLTGGIEQGETEEETTSKEIVEETGFKNITKVQPLHYVSHGLFYHIVKHENRLAHYNLVYAKLGGLEQDQVSEEELAIAKFMWVERDKVEETLSRGDMKKLWRFYLQSEVSS